MICDRLDVLMLFQWSSQVLVCVSCVVCGCLRCWIVVLGPRLQLCGRVVLHVVCECFVIASASASANANADANGKGGGGRGGGSGCRWPR